jgi:hypothetical protein
MSSFFDLNDDEILDEKVEPITAINFQVAVLHWQRHLPLELDVASSQLTTETRLIGRLQQPGAELTVNVNRSADDRFRDL